MQEERNGKKGKQIAEEKKKREIERDRGREKKNI